MKFVTTLSLVAVLGMVGFGASAACSGGGSVSASGPVAAAAAAQNPKAESASFADINHNDLAKLVADKKVILIDCNGSDTFKANHIPGAIDFEANGANLDKLLPKDKDTLIVAYCGNEFCPAYKSGAEAVAKLGYTNVKHYPLGIAGWLKSGEKTEKGS